MMFVLHFLLFLLFFVVCAALLFLFSVLILLLCAVFHVVCAAALPLHQNVCTAFDVLLLLFVLFLPLLAAA